MLGYANLLNDQGVELARPRLGVDLSEVYRTILMFHAIDMAQTDYRPLTAVAIFEEAEHGRILYLNNFPSCEPNGGTVMVNCSHFQWPLEWDLQAPHEEVAQGDGTCPECFGTGFRGGFQTPCSRRCVP